MAAHHFDIVIVGAGISGIGTAYHLQQKCAQKSYVILEGRESLGGTWDLFRYPGIRSDSDMLTMAYSFKPWGDTKATAEGAEILSYVRETAEENGITDHIHYNKRVVSANWSSEYALWTVQTTAGDSYTCNFFLMCAGYYSYEKGYTPEFKGHERFGGTIVHPQAWSDDLNYEDKQVVVIGSGATAVTLIPKLAEKAKHVVMLQRSPTYMRATPNQDSVAAAMRKILPNKVAYNITRWKSILLGNFFYRRTRTHPEKTKKMLLDMVKDELPEDYDIDTHFTPSYFPWDERICLVPDGDLFTAIREGTASVVTDHIDSFTETGIALKSGEHLDADIVVTATGLNLEVMGGIDFIVDGKSVDFAQTVSYKGMMCSDVPNMVLVFGYINASWTLGVDLTANYICRVINHMDKAGVRFCVPRYDESEGKATQPWVKDFSSGYMQRSMHLLPKQGNSDPWTNSQDYMRDRKIIGKAPVDDGVLAFEA